jgi:deazaflavin-dependent oxidoreductase (nitroreductase family)
VVLLTTTGRRSGKARTTAIWAYPDDEALVLVGSSGGRGSTPGWVFNLRAYPEATVQARGGARRVRAREAQGEEYERLWKLAVAAYPGYEAYQEWTAGRIPVVVLE